MKTFKEFVNEDIYKGIEDKIRKLHDTAKDGVLKHDGEVYTLKFDRYQGEYKVTDSLGNHIMNINDRKINSAKKFLKKWLES